jgi:hypothetical protein
MLNISKISVELTLVFSRCASAWTILYDSERRNESKNQKLNGIQIQILSKSKSLSYSAFTINVLTS